MIAQTRYNQYMHFPTVQFLPQSNLYDYIIYQLNA